MIKVYNLKVPEGLPCTFDIDYHGLHLEGYRKGKRIYLRNYYAPVTKCVDGIDRKYLMCVKLYSSEIHEINRQIDNLMQCE